MVWLGAKQRWWWWWWGLTLHSRGVEWAHRRSVSQCTACWVRLGLVGRRPQSSGKQGLRLSSCRSATRGGCCPLQPQCLQRILSPRPWWCHEACRGAWRPLTSCPRWESSPDSLRCNQADHPWRTGTQRMRVDSIRRIVNRCTRPLSPPGSV